MDNKDVYSKKANDYVKKDVNENAKEKERYNRSKKRELEHNDTWIKQTVNINEIISKFTPKVLKEYTESGIKYCWEGDKYIIKADKAAGYLRILDKSQKKYVKINGEIGNRDETHFKIAKKEE